ncbi:VOC family protein [Lysinibacillus sp. BW-2-10]|uniref:VOC family protein n=1 Tax=Lysinibacillus sp. BW-2-10 TaxID=2590030 RepID=UPI00117E999A|nr:VOC family protein [Lysinibacillus sp. BW-2-10]TSI08989.1 2,3-dihydroxybiphenyl 1,2-dioxygenase [Lysinibacillus sp. BW-2-10]
MGKPEIAKLGHVAIVTSDLEKSLWFFREVIGLEETEEIDGVHYLRAWGDFQHHTLSLEQGESGYLKHIGWRTKNKEDVQQFKQLLEEEGVDVTYLPKGATPGIGEAIRFKLPSLHTFELYYDVERPPVAEHRRSVLKNQTYKSWAKGVSPRRFDHVNIHTSTEVDQTYDFLLEKLGFKLREYLVNEEGNTIAGWMSVTPLVHDVAVLSKPNLPTPARLHHISYWSDDTQDILRAADILKENGIQFIGPGKHGISQAMYLYVMDPGSGCRVELFTGGYLIFEPDWEPVKWTMEERSLGNTYWGDSVQDKELNNITIEAK